MIQDKLENQISDVVIQGRRDPKFIVMHPQTWVDLVKEMSGIDGIGLNLYTSGMKYKGIKVLRSFDLLEGEFEM